MKICDLFFWLQSNKRDFNNKWVVVTTYLKQAELNNRKETVITLELKGRHITYYLDIFIEV